MDSWFFNFETEQDIDLKIAIQIKSDSSEYQPEFFFSIFKTQN